MGIGKKNKNYELRKKREYLQAGVLVNAWIVSDFISYNVFRNNGMAIQIERTREELECEIRELYIIIDEMEKANGALLKRIKNLQLD